MKATGIIRRFDDLGRINIPKEIRKQLFGTKCTVGEPMELFLDGENVVLRKYQDVCEWKMDNVGASIGCRKDLHHTGYVTEKICPFCKKKIKVVQKRK